MQALKDKLQDMTALRKVKAEAKAQEKAEKEIAQEMMNNNPAEKDIAKARIDIAHEVRRAKEAEAAMELHVAKAGERAEKEIAKHSSNAAGGGTNLMNPATMGAPNDPTSGSMHVSNMHASNMDGSNMHGANIHGANVHGADMHGANLHGTDMHSANMHGAPHDLHTRK